MQQIVLIIHILTAIALIGFILIQQGKGADAGAAFGSGASQTLFGSKGSGDFLSHTTAILVTIFFITSLALGYLVANQAKPKNLDDLLNQVQQQEQQQSAPNKQAVPKEEHSEIPQ
jgi:preprotein translocase subunit SecG